jgi:hypothetical protein
VDAATAQDQGLLANQDGHLILKADSSSVLDPAGAGRNSVRLESKKTFNAGTVAVCVSYIVIQNNTSFLIRGNEPTVSTSTTCPKAAGEYLPPDPCDPLHRHLWEADNLR